MRVPKIGPNLEGFVQSRNTVVRIPYVIEESDPKDRDRAVVLSRVAAKFGDVPDGDTCDLLGVLETVGQVEKCPCEAEMSLVAKVLLGLCLMEKAEAISQVESGHPVADARSRNSWKETRMALMNASESGRVL